MFEPDRGTRSTLRLGKAELAARPNEHVLLLPVWIGQHRLAIEATRVVEVVPGAWANPRQGDSTVVTADLYRALGVLAPEDRETVLARSDGRLGRGPGTFVAFAVDRAQRLVKAPLENLAPLPEIARVQIAVDFIVGVVRMQFPDDGMAFLLDPKKLAAQDDARGSAARPPAEELP
jgi:hypothetical protein